MKETTSAKRKLTKPQPKLVAMATGEEVMKNFLEKAGGQPITLTFGKNILKKTILSEEVTEITVVVTEAHCAEAIRLQNGFRQWNLTVAMALMLSLEERHPELEWFADLDGGAISYTLNGSVTYFYSAPNSYAAHLESGWDGLLHPFTAVFISDEEQQRLRDKEYAQVQERKAAKKLAMKGVPDDRND